MLRDITLGQYYRADSFIHKLDPRVKLLGVFAYLILLFVYENIFSYLLAGLFLMFIIYVSKVPLKFILRGLNAIFIILFISVIFNIFYTPGRVFFEFHFIKITYEGIIKAIFTGIRFVLIIISSSMLTLTTTPNNLTDGLEKSLGFLKKIKVPVHEIALMMSIALRFIPILMEETDKIMKAQIARGADFESGGLLKKAKKMIPILVPLIISSFKRAGDLATAMDARCYRGGEFRTKMRPLKYNRNDGIGYAVIGGFTMIMIVINLL